MKLEYKAFLLLFIVIIVYATCFLLLSWKDNLADTLKVYTLSKDNYPKRKLSMKGEKKEIQKANKKTFPKVMR